MIADHVQEALVICAEECAEVIQAISKIQRFGMTNVYRGVSGQESLEKELGDLLALMNILQEQDTISWNNVERYADAKREKLKIWSNLIA
jgi:NTP pyrophosphatase (non-canonical NTP hydrolase)